MVTRERKSPPRLMQRALDPTTPAETLLSWSERPFLGLRRYVAQNPNTPTEALWKLALCYPEEVLTNPVFPLLWLESPDLAQRLDIIVVEALTRFPEQCPRPLLMRLRAMTQRDFCTLLKAWMQDRDQHVLPGEGETYDYVLGNIQGKGSIVAWQLKVRLYNEQALNVRRLNTQHRAAGCQKAVRRIRALLDRLDWS